MDSGSEEYQPKESELKPPEQKEVKERDLSQFERMVPLSVRKLFSEGLGSEGKETVDVSEYRFGGVSFKENWGTNLNDEQKDEIKIELLRGMMDQGWWFQPRPGEAYVFIAMNENREETIDRLQEFSTTMAPEILKNKFTELGVSEDIQLGDILAISLGQEPDAPCPVTLLPSGEVYQAAPASSEVVTGAIGAKKSEQFIELMTPEQRENFRRLPVLIQSKAGDDETMKVIFGAKKKELNMWPMARREKIDKARWSDKTISLSTEQQNRLATVSVDSYLNNQELLDLMTDEQKQQLGKEIVEVEVGERKLSPIEVDVQGDRPDVDLGGMSLISEIITNEIADPDQRADAVKAFGLLMSRWQKETAALMREAGFGCDNFGGDSVSGLGRSLEDPQEIMRRAEASVEVSVSFDKLLGRVLNGEEISDDSKVVVASKWLANRIGQIEEGSRVIVKMSLESVEASIQIIPSLDGTNSLAQLKIPNDPEYLMDLHKAWQRQNPGRASTIIGPRMLAKIEEAGVVPDSGYELIKLEGYAILRSL